MKKILFLLTLCWSVLTYGQTESDAGKWKTWFISSGKDYRLPAPKHDKNDVATVIKAQSNLSEKDLQQILFWNAGAPGYRWQEMINKLWMNDTSRYGALANMLLGTAIYDATVAAWDTKYAYNRSSPFKADKRIKLLIPKPEHPSYPCEYSVAAGVAATIISKFYPHLQDSVQRMAHQVMQTRIAAGVAFSGDVKAGFELGKRIAEKEIDVTKEFITKQNWDGKLPEGPGKWNGKSPMYPFASLNKTVVLANPAQFRPPAPPDFSKEMEELKNYKQNFRSQANAFYWASQDFWSEALSKKLFEYNLHLNPPAAARIYAAANVAAYDGFIACFDAKYAYWGIRPHQFDTTYKPLVPTPPFPGYPSGHAMMSGMFAELYSFFFPTETNYFRKKAKEAAESRFQAGIHFRSDNEVGLEMGRKVADAVINKIKRDGVGEKTLLAKTKAY